MDEKTQFPVEDLEALFFGRSKKAGHDGKPNGEIGQSADSAELKDKDKAAPQEGEPLGPGPNFDQDLTAFLASKKDSPSREDKVERAATLGLV